jgi:hypothetical protein
VKLRPQSVIHLHPLYHRREGEHYVVGNPETGEFLYITPAEFRVIQLLNAQITLRQIKELVEQEKDAVDVDALIHELHDKGFIHKLDTRIITPLHEPIHEATLPVRFLGGPAARFLFILLSVFGLATLVFFGTFPSFFVFFFTDKLSIILLSVIMLSWLFVAARQLVKYAACLYLEVPARFGFSSAYHAFVPKVYTSPMSPEQEHYVTGMSLASLTALTSISLLCAVFVSYPFNQFWWMVFAIGIIELLAECLLFMDTDLARFITLTTNIHKLNKQTAKSLAADWKAFWKGKSKQSHPAITTYSFFYLASIIMAAVLLFTYIVPAMLYFLVLAFEHFKPGHPLFVDSFIALLFFSSDLLLYGFALLRRHPLAHNDLFVNSSLVAIVIGSFLLATLGVEWFGNAGDFFLSILLIYGLGMMLALLFEHAVKLAHPFSEHHTVFESVLLPIIAASIPLTILFTTTVGLVYLYAFVLGFGMLTVVGMRHFVR